MNDLKEELNREQLKVDDDDEWETEDPKNNELLAENASLRAKINVLEKEVDPVEFSSIYT